MKNYKVLLLLFFCALNVSFLGEKIKVSNSEKSVLIDAYVLLSSTTENLIDKKENDYFVRIVVTIKTKDGHEFVGQAEAWDSTKIESGKTLKLPLRRRSQKEGYDITFENIKSVSDTVWYTKSPTLAKLKSTNDEWEPSIEVVLKFANDSILSTGVQNANVKLHFNRKWQKWLPSGKVIERDKMLPAPQILYSETK